MYGATVRSLVIIQLERDPAHTRFPKVWTKSLYAGIPPRPPQQTPSPIARLPLDAQLSALRTTLSHNDILLKILERSATLNLPHWYLTAGCLFQTVWNVVTGRPPPTPSRTTTSSTSTPRTSPGKPRTRRSAPAARPSPTSRQTSRSATRPASTSGTSGNSASPARPTTPWSQRSTPSRRRRAAWGCDWSRTASGGSTRRMGWPTSSTWWCGPIRYWRLGRRTRRRRRGGGRRGRSCGSCHGPDLRGATLFPALAKLSKKRLIRDRSVPRVWCTRERRWFGRCMQTGRVRWLRASGPSPHPVRCRTSA